MNFEIGKIYTCSSSGKCKVCPITSLGNRDNTISLKTRKFTFARLAAAPLGDCFFHEVSIDDLSEDEKATYQSFFPNKEPSEPILGRKNVDKIISKILNK